MRRLVSWPIHAVAVAALVGPVFVFADASAVAATGDGADASSETSTAVPSAPKTPSVAPTPTSEPDPVPEKDTAGVSGAAEPTPPLKDDPSLSEMNAAHNHAMGSTLAKFDAGAVPTQKKARSFQTFAANPPSTYIWGLDVSGWQVLNESDWRQIWANGARFAYVKATESTDYTSSQFSEQYTDSYNAGLAHGAYHFATPNTSSGAAQANFFVNNGGGWTPDGRTLPPLLDIEYNPYGGDTCYGLSQEAMVSWIADFSSTILSRTGRLPAIYTTTDWWNRCTGSSSAFAANPLFIARWGNTISEGPGTLPAGWSTYAFWQTGDTGTFPGDQDLFNGSLDDLRQFALDGSTPYNRLRSPVFGVGDFNSDRKPDLIARKPDGTLWFYAGAGGTGGWGYAAGRQIGHGWGIYDAIIGAGDFNSDEHPDLIARKPDGTLWFYAGTGVVDSSHDGYRPAVKIGRSSWNEYTEIVGAGDIGTDGNADLIARRPDGTLWLYAGTGVVDSNNEGYTAAVQIGVGWTTFQQLLGLGDLDRDGHADLLAKRDDGTLWLYRGNGGIGGNSYYAAGKRISAPGVTQSDLLAAAGDLDKDGYPDLVAKTASGTLEFIAGTTSHAENYLPAQMIGTGGWAAYDDVIGVGDFNGNGTADLVARNRNGTLWFYDGTGDAGSGAEGYRPAQQIGWADWDMYTRLVPAGDFDGDGKQDFLAVKDDGTLWLYRGTGIVDGSHNGLDAAVKIGWNGWASYSNLVSGDFNGDGKPDLIATRADGTLWFYAGTQRSAAYYEPATNVGHTGWNAYDMLIGVGDFDDDGKADFLGRRPDGTLWLYRGNGAMSASNDGYQPAVKIGTGWSVYQRIFGVHDFNGDGTADFASYRPDGTLWFYAGTGGKTVSISGFTLPAPMGSGWNAFG